MLSDQDFQYIKNSLGRSPQGVSTVVARDQADRPTVIKVFPWVNSAPFPTLYWLVSPNLLKSISTLEAQGTIKKWEEKIACSIELINGLKSIHQSYADARWDFFNSATRPIIESNQEKVIQSTGIGGIQDFSRIRCLHMTYAYHLVKPNFIGHWIDEELQGHLKANFI